MNNYFTIKMAKFVDGLRNEGYTWLEIQDEFEEAFGEAKSHDNLRMMTKRLMNDPDQISKSTSVNDRILFISDMHIPYQHPDTVSFLNAVKEKYQPTKVICVGDEVDKHAMSFHDSDPDLSSAGDELTASIKILKKIYKIFPEVDLVDSNHGSMAYRKAKHHGIPRKYIKDYGEILEAPDGWKWYNDLILTLPNKQKVYVCHGMSSNGITFAGKQGMSVVQGHHHTKFYIQYASSPAQLYFAMHVGCLIDDESLAFEYNKITPGRPIIGLGMIIDSLPVLIPMILNKGGRWNGKC